MIVVEGPDGSGKTTLINEIQSQFSVTLSPRVVSKDAEAMVDLMEWVEYDNQKLSQGVVYDRHRLISEPIYGPVLRDRTQPGFDQPTWLGHMMRQFYEKKPILIYCLPPKAEVLGHTESLPKGATPRQAEAIYDLYVAKASADWGCRRGYIYDYTSHQIKNLMGVISREEMF